MAVWWPCRRRQIKAQSVRGGGRGKAEFKAGRRSIRRFINVLVWLYLGVIGVPFPDGLGPSLPGLGQRPQANGRQIVKPPKPARPGFGRLAFSGGGVGWECVCVGHHRRHGVPWVQLNQDVKKLVYRGGVDASCVRKAFSRHPLDAVPQRNPTRTRLQMPGLPTTRSQHRLHESSRTCFSIGGLSLSRCRC